MLQKIELENKIPDVADFVKKAKLSELENKIPDISNSATKTALTTVENKIPDFSNLVKKTDYDTKLTEMENKLNNHNHDKYIDTQQFNKLTADVFNARIAQANLMTDTDFDAKLSSLNRKITANKTKHLLAENELKKLQTFDSSYFIDKDYFGDDGLQNYLVFQPLQKYFTFINDTQYYTSWKSTGLSPKVTKPFATYDNSLTPTINFVFDKARVKFNESCLNNLNRNSFINLW